MSSISNVFIADPSKKEILKVTRGVMDPGGRRPCGAEDEGNVCGGCPGILHFMKTMTNSRLVDRHPMNTQHNHQHISKLHQQTNTTSAHQQQQYISAAAPGLTYWEVDDDGVDVLMYR
jgi:hypothetical protein